MEEPEDIAQSWLDTAARHRQHVEKYPNCIDSDERLRSAALYERYAREEQSKSGEQNAESSVQLSPKGD